jgi:hypothetical protein
MSDLQGTIKEQIIAAKAMPKPWELRLHKPSSTKPLKTVRPRHRMAVALHMGGYDNVQIAAHLGYTPQRISAIINSKHPGIAACKAEFASKVALATGDVVLRFHSEANKCLDKLIQIRDRDDAPISEQRQSALAILDRAGYTPIKKQINIDSQIPFQELRGVVDRLDSANEVVVRKSEWSVKSFATGG